MDKNGFSEPDQKVRRKTLKLLSQIGIVFAICWLGTLIEAVLPFPLPASVIAMLILLVLLLVRVLHPRHVQEKSDFLLGNLQFFFIPATVGIMNYVDVLRENLVVLPVICIVSTIATFAVTAATVTLTNRLLNRRKKP
jgi:holin-like protein